MDTSNKIQTSSFKIKKQKIKSQDEVVMHPNLR